MYINKLISVSVLATCLSFGLSNQLQANPSGATVVHGSASFSQPNTNSLHITNTPGAIINWQQFGVGANEVTKFIQQSSSSAVLNRITGQNPSQILGSLQSNGRVSKSQAHDNILSLWYYAVFNMISVISQPLFIYR